MERRTFLNIGLTGLGTTVAMAAPVPLQYIPRPSKEKWAVLYGTWYGTARDASVWISEGMGGIAAVCDIRQVPPDLVSYDHLVIGTAIQAGKGPAALEAYLNSNIDRLQSKIRGLFVVCGNLGRQPGPQQVATYIDGYLAKLCRTTSVPNRVFGGRITQALMPEAEFKGIADMYAKVGGPVGDWDNLSRMECLKLGREVYAGRG